MLFTRNYFNLVVVILFSVLAAHGEPQSPESTDLGKTTPAPVFKVGGHVLAPKLIYGPDPEYSKEARAENYGGNCLLWLVVGPDGKPRDIRVVRALKLGLDEKAIEAVKNWRFAPAMIDGIPVAVQINVDVAFHPHGEKINTRFLKLEKKANAGDPKAQLELSRDYFEGRAIPQNEVFGLELLKRAANQGLAQAQFLMGEHAYSDARKEDPKGDSSSADYVQAYTWYELALRGGYKQSEKKLKELAPKMSPEQLSDAKTRADNWPNPPAR